MLIKRFDKFFNTDNLQEDLRKLGTSFITGGGGALFLSTAYSHLLMLMAFCVIIIGVFCELLGLYRRHPNESK